MLTISARQKATYYEPMTPFYYNGSKIFEFACVDDVDLSWWLKQGRKKSDKLDFKIHVSMVAMLSSRFSTLRRTIIKYLQLSTHTTLSLYNSIKDDISGRKKSSENDEFCMSEMIINTAR